MPDEPIELIVPEWPAPRQIRALATTRKGGYSTGPFDSFNLATHVGDNLSSVEANRDLLRRAAQLPAEPCWLNQTHSSLVTRINNDRDYQQDSDAAITSKKGQILAIMTADCLPVLLCDRQGSEIAAIHAGWRGLVDGIIENTLEAMESPAHQLMAWIGPAISQRRFEIGEDVYRQFTGRDRTTARFFSSNRQGHWLCDLPGLAGYRLSRIGVKPIYQSGFCSFDDRQRFYSYRRTKVTGRMACLIWINNHA